MDVRVLAARGGRGRLALLWSTAATALLLAAGVMPAGAAEVNLTTFRNNTGIVQTPLSNANFDGGGWSYSSVALRVAGLDPGEVITTGGHSYTWPNTADGAKDNVAAGNQTIPVTPPAGATKVGFLGVSTNGPVTAVFKFNYTYVDAVTGETKSVSVPTTLTFSDWTLNAGMQAAHASNTIVVTSAFRMTADNLQPERVNTHVFALSTPLDATKTLKSITLPPLTGSGQVHLFGMSIV